MPIYEYACTACGERTEAKQGFDDPPLEDCPLCGGRLRKLYSPVGIVFKGSGFYSTDQKSSKNAGKTDAKTDAKASDDSKKSDKKPETKSTKSADTAKSSSSSD